MDCPNIGANRDDQMSDVVNSPPNDWMALAQSECVPIHGNSSPDLPYHAKFCTGEEGVQGVPKGEGASGDDFVDLVQGEHVPIHRNSSPDLPDHTKFYTVGEGGRGANEGEQGVPKVPEGEGAAGNEWMDLAQG